MDIIRGNIHVDDLTTTSPTTTVVQNPDAHEHLDPLLKSQVKPAEAKPVSTVAAAKPPQVDVRKVTISGCEHFECVQNQKEPHAGSGGVDECDDGR